MAEPLTRPMEALRLAGKLIMENGGETYRVEETITRMGHAFGMHQVESFAVPSGVFVSHRREDGTCETAVVRVRRKGINLVTVNDVNSVSRLVEAGEMDCDAALRRLQEIEQAPASLSESILLAGYAISAGGFSVLFGGGVIDLVVAAVIALCVQLFSRLLQRFSMQQVASTLLGSLLSAFSVMVFHQLTGMGIPDAIVAGTLMPMVPGLAMANAVQDAMRGDIISALSHCIQAVMIASLVASGALIGSAVFRLLWGGVL